MKLVDIDTAKKEKAAVKRKKRKEDNAPKIKCSAPDGTYYKFSVTYMFNHKNYTFDLWAKTTKEAELRLHHIKRFPCEITLIHDEVAR